MSTIRKPKESEFRESVVYGAVRETSEASSTVSSGFGNFIFLAVLIFICWGLLFSAFLPFVHALLSFDLETLAETTLPTALFCLAIYIVAQRIRRRREQMRSEQLGEAANYVSQTGDAGIVDDREVEPVSLPSQLKYSPKAITSKAILLGFVALVLGGLSFGEPGFMMLLGAYYAARCLVLAVNIPRAQTAFDASSHTLKAMDLIGNTKELSRDAILNVSATKSPLWDIVTPLLLGARTFVQISGVLPDERYVKLRVSHRMIGVHPEDVMVILKQAEVQGVASAECRSTKQPRQSAPSEARQAPIARAQTRPQSDLPQVRASFGRKGL